MRILFVSSVILLMYKANEGVLSKSWFVSQSSTATDLNDCHNWTMACRTVRHAVEISNDGDEIHIEHARGRPYMECENATDPKACSIQLKWSISFHGVNGRSIVKCKKSCKLFAIKSTSVSTVNVGFYDLVIQSADTVVECSEATAFEIVIENSTIADNFIGVHSRSSISCGIKVHNSIFQKKANWAIWLRCTNLTAHITSSVFKRNPIWLQTIYNEHKKFWQTVEVFVRQSIFDGEHNTVLADLLSIRPYTVLLNVSIWNSAFLNHIGMTKYYSFSSLFINDHNPTQRNGTYVSVRNIKVENSLNKLAAVTLKITFNVHAFEVEIVNSLFRNNSAALDLHTFNLNRNKTTRMKTTIFLHNNTFTQNFNGLGKYIISAPAILFSSGSYQVSSCCFHDNKASKSPFSAVVTVSEDATVDFYDCYFENRQIATLATQLYAKGGTLVAFHGKNIFNMTALNTGQAVFLRIPFRGTTGVTLKREFKLLCPQGYVLHSQKICKNYINSIYCIYVYLTCEKCPHKTYAIDKAEFVYNTSNSFHCMPCPRGGSCLDGVVKARSNFWGYKTNTSIKFAQCPPGYCCNSKDCVSYDSCHGKRTGTLCGRCVDGMSDGLFSSSCISNTKCSVSLFIPSALVLLVLYLLFFLYHEEIERVIAKIIFGSFKFFTWRRIPARHQKNERNRRGGLLKVVFYYYQVVRLLQSTVGSQKRNHIIAKLKDFIARISNMVLVDTAFLNCPFQNLQPVQKIAILHSVGYCLLVLLGILYFITVLVLRLRKCKKSGYNEMRNMAASEEARHSSTFEARIASAFTYISLLMYASSTQLCLSLLHCVPVGESQVLFLDGNIKCYQTFQYILLVYVISSVFPFCLVPVLGSYLLKTKRISVAQFCIACIFPLPFCCFWIYLVVREYRLHKRVLNNSSETSRDIDETVEDNYLQEHCTCRFEEDRPFRRLQDQVQCRCRSTCESGCKIPTNEAILRVLLGPFRNHKPFLCFPESILPWEGYLIFRRLVLIIVLTFVHDNRLKMMLTLTLCVAILSSHMCIKPFTSSRVNAIESLSLSVLSVFCGFTLIKSLYYGEDFSSLSENARLLNVFTTIENILVVIPLAILLLVLVLSVLGRLLLLIRKCIGHFRM